MAGHRFEIGECVAYLEKRFPNGSGAPSPWWSSARRTGEPKRPARRNASPLRPRRKQARPDLVRRGGGRRLDASLPAPGGSGSPWSA